MYHYVYNIIGEDFRFYIGRRSSEVHPLLDTIYEGSPTDKTFKPIIKHILAIFDKIELASQLEHELHKLFKVDINKQYANRCIATKSGQCSTSKGYKHTEKAKENYKKGNKGKNKGHKRTTENKSRISSSCKKFWENPENRTKMIEAYSKRHCTEEGKQKRKESYRKIKENGYRQSTEKKYLFLDKSDIQHEIYLSDVHKYGLTKSAVCNLVNHPEKHKHHKGWRVIGCVLI